MFVRGSVGERIGAYVVRWGLGMSGYVGNVGNWYANVGVGDGMLLHYEPPTCVR
jgi:hypothetical protein